MENIRKIRITDDELRKMEHIGSGGYGSVYADKENGFVIKKYHEYIYCFFERYKNPCLNINKTKYKRLNDRQEKIKYTDTNLDLVYDYFHFIGVKKKYYDSVELASLDNISLSIKKEYLRQLIRNVEELNRNRIYCLDYKPNNIVVTKSGEVKIIDLDDICTKATLLPSFFYKNICLQKLKETILGVIYDNQLYYSESIAKRLSSSPENKPYLQKKMNYKELQQFVDYVKFDENILVIKIDYIDKINISKLKGYLKNNNLSLVLAYDKDKKIYGSFIEDSLQILERNEIIAYDMFKYFNDYEDNLNKYIISHEASNIHTYDDNIKVLKKK